MRIEKNFSIKKFNTFGVETRAKYFARVYMIRDLMELTNIPIFKESKIFILGGGSNVLFTKDFDGLIVKNEIKGIKILKGAKETVLVRASSGEDWNEFVNFCVEKNLWGIENLSCIPGTVGGVPIQNIGAYGVEAKDVIKSVGWIDMKSGELFEYENKECDFSYRNSIFKNELKNKAFVVYVDFLLSKKSNPHLEYAGVFDLLGGKQTKHLTPREISRAICEIRKSKLPDIHKVGTAGSFFKNPIISKKHFQKIQEDYAGISNFEIGKGYKIPAGWLIEQCGFKGYREGNVGVYDKHALILINYGGVTGKEIVKLAEKIKKSVVKKFKIELEEEVCLV